MKTRWLSLLLISISTCFQPIFSDKRNYLTDKASHGSSWFHADRVFTLFALILALFLVALGSEGDKIIALTWYLTTWLFFLGTWAFGFIGPTKQNLRWHVVVVVIRTLHCLTTYFLLTQFGVFGKNYNFYIMLMGVLVHTTVFHLYGSCQRILGFQTKKSVVLAMKTTRKSSHEIFGRHMRYLSPQQGEVLRAEALCRINDYQARSSAQPAGSPGWNYWYHPKLNLEHRPVHRVPGPGRLKHWLHTFIHISPSHFSQNSERLVSQDSNQPLHIEHPLFSKCSCCLETDLPPQKLYPSRLAPAKEAKRRLEWGRVRRLFREQPQNCHPSMTEESATEVMKSISSRAFVHHHLCEQCLAFCTQSSLLSLAEGWNMRSVGAFLRNAFTAVPVVDESFELWTTASELKSSAEGNARNSPCHLCTLIWTSINDEQQTKLLSESEELRLQLERDELAAGDCQERLEELRRRFHTERAVVIKIQSPSSQSRWAKAWSSKQFGKQSLQLIPHFGDRMLAQRWMKARQAVRAISSDRDPTLEWHREHVDPIEIHYMNLNDLGPIIPPIGESTGSTTSMAYIKSWMKSHDHSIEGFQELPTRLIDVGENDDSIIRLVTSSEIDDQSSSSRTLSRPRPRYIALSHCWGGDISFVLKTTNEMQFRIAINFEELAPSFQDAVRIARRLDFRYLWIDSLCIIQKSPEDWIRESARMTNVYSNAECVIAAAASWSSKENFLVEQNPLALSPCIIGVAGKLSKKMGHSLSSNSHFGGIYALPSTRYTKDAYEDVTLSKLHSRAWVFQEEQLAKQIIYFGPHQLHLKCKACRYVTRQVSWNEGEDYAPVLFAGLPYRGIKHFLIEADLFPDLRQPKVLQALLAFIASFVKECVDLVIALVKQCLKSLLVTPWKRDISAQWREEQLEDAIPLMNVEDTTEAVATIMATSMDPDSHAATASATNHLEKSIPADLLLRRKWWRAVSDYSSRFLTERGDKLPAIAGIAGLYRDVAQDQGLIVDYLAGLWSTQEYLAMGLLWYVSSGRTVRPPIKKGSSTLCAGLPSWSWVSVDGTISNNSHAGAAPQQWSGIEILDALTTYDNPNFHGGPQRFSLHNCSQGHLLVNGVVKAARWERREGRVKRYYIGHNVVGPEIIRDESHLEAFVPFIDDPKAGPEAFDLLTIDGTQVGHFIPDATEDTPGEDEDIYCLRIAVQPSNVEEQKDYNVPWAIRGLALTKTGRTYIGKTSVGIGTSLQHLAIAVPGDLLAAMQGVHEYRRIGYFELNKTLGALAFPHGFPVGSFTKGFYKRADRMQPETDIMGFFESCEKQTIIIT